MSDYIFRLDPMSIAGTGSTPGMDVDVQQLRERCVSRKSLQPNHAVMPRFGPLALNSFSTITYVQPAARVVAGVSYWFDCPRMRLRPPSCNRVLLVLLAVAIRPLSYLGCQQHRGAGRAACEVQRRGRQSARAR